jgi:hypothetical protein
MANVHVTRVPRTTALGHLADGASLVLVLLAVPVGLLLVGVPIALLIKGALALAERLF